ncbi:MAG: Mur ligase family protein [Elusimicrobiales bacterium]|nr:Mur ligase family protein [Elusimicrobiales bacterium]
MAKYYFCGIAGNGMSALAQIVKSEGHEVEGSDRSFDIGENLDIKEKFSKMSIKIHPQNGNYITKDIDYFIYSTAIENENTEYKKAKEEKIKMIHRSELLNHYVNRYKTIAVGGTSGKTTLTALIWHIFNTLSLKPLLINGGYLLSLMEKGLIGNAYYDNGDILVIEADESDATIEKYHPQKAIIHNITKDHKTIEELEKIFLRFALNSETVYINEDEPLVYSLYQKIQKKAKLYGKNSANLKILKIHLSNSKFNAYGQEFNLPLGGLHNIYNAIAAIRISLDEGINIKDIAYAVSTFKGTFRRFNIIGEINGIKVIDDYAHNPHKILATLTHCIETSPNNRLIVIYQPHGFAPTRMFKNDLIEIFSKKLRINDILIMPEIYYAGGSVNKDISSLDIIKEVKKEKKHAYYFDNRNEIINFISNISHEEDIIIVFGARDPTLHRFAIDIYKNIQEKYDKIYKYGKEK